jgi:Ca-activated chloride channel family protein
MNLPPTARRRRRQAWLLGLALAAGAAGLGWGTSAFGRPAALVGLMLVLALWLLLVFEAQHRAAARERLITADLLARAGEPSPRAAWGLRAAMLTVALVLLVLAAARPKGGPGPADDTERGADLMLALDVSNSMRTVDMGGESRLDSAKRVLKEFIGRDEGDRLGLLAFAGSADVKCPFTTDHDAVATLLDDVDYYSVTRQGTQIGLAIQACLPCFVEQPGVGRAIVLLSDGEDLGSDPLAAARAAREHGVVIDTIGLGTPEGGTIPMPVDDFHNTAPKRYDNKVVISRLDESTLQAIAETTGGRYLRADSPARLHQIMQAVAGLGRQAVSHQEVDQRTDLFAWLCCCWPSSRWCDCATGGGGNGGRHDSESL